MRRFKKDMEGTYEIIQEGSAFTVCAIIGNVACFESSDDKDAVKTEFARSVIDDAIESIADEACIPDNPKTDIDIEHDGLLIYVTWEIPQPGVANATFTITFDTYHIRDSHVSGQIEGAFTFTYDPVTKKRLMPGVIRWNTDGRRVNARRLRFYGHRNRIRLPDPADFPQRNTHN